MNASKVFTSFIKMYYYAYAGVSRWKYRYINTQDISASNYVYMLGQKLKVSLCHWLRRNCSCARK